MATVFRAHDPELDRFVAVKVLPSFQAEDPTFVERFRREARAVAGLNHSNIIQVHDFGEDKGFNFIVMELVTGGTLHDRMGRKLPLTEVMGLVLPLASALDYAHQRGIIHRDIKPSNVLLDEDGRPILSDFGLARIVEGSAGLTRPDAVMGTPEYMAPEQALGRKADQRADLYALGIIIYQMLLGRTPFKSDTPSTTLMAHIHSPVPLPTAEDPDFDPLLEATLIRALAKDPDDRYQTSADFVEALRKASPEQDLPATQPMGAEAGDSDTLVEAPADTTAGAGVQPPVRDDESTRISPDRAGVLAIRHARENTEFYGHRYSGRELIWEIVASEEGESYFQVELSYRPSGRFFGKPGTEKFTIDKSGAVELRQLEREPSEGFRQLINESVGIAGRRIPLVGVVLVVVIGIVVAGLLSSGPFRSGESGAASGRATVAVLPGAPALLASPDGAVTVDVQAGSVSEAVDLAYRPALFAELPALPPGFALGSKFFDLTVNRDGTSQASFSVDKPVTVSVRLSDDDERLANGFESSLAIQHYRDGQWAALATTVDFDGPTAHAQIETLSLLALTIKPEQATPSPTPEPSPTAVPEAPPTPTPTPTEAREAKATPVPPPEGHSAFRDETHGFSFHYPDYLSPTTEGGGFLAQFPTGGGLVLASGQLAVGLDLQKFVNLNIDTMKEIFSGFEVVGLGQSTFIWSATVLGVEIEIGDGTLLEFTFRDASGQRFRGKTLMGLNRAGPTKTAFLLQIVAPQDGFTTFDEVFLRAVESVELFEPDAGN